MRLFEVTITMNACFADDLLYYKFTRAARNEKQLFRKLKRSKWIKFSTVTKSSGIEYTSYSHLQRRNVADIYIREVNA